MIDDPELLFLEQELRALQVEPSTALRDRVLATVRCEFRHEGVNGWAWTAAAAAALVLLSANVSWHVIPMPSPISSPHESRAELTAQLRELLPELSPEDARQQAAWMENNTGLPNGDAARARQYSACGISESLATQHKTADGHTMGYLFLGIENLAVTLLFVAVAITLISRLHRRWLRIILAVSVVLVPLLGYVLLITVDAMFEFTQQMRTGWFIPLILMSLLFLSGATWLVVRGLWPRTPLVDFAEQLPPEPTARSWPLGKLVLALVTAVVLQVIAFSNLDATARQSLDVLRSEAYALSMSVAPEPIPDHENAALDYLKVQEALQRGKPPFGKVSPEWPQIWLDAEKSLQANEQSEDE